MKPEYLFARMDVCTDGSQEQDRRRLMIEVEVDAAEIDANGHEVHQAIRQAIMEAAGQRALKHVDNELEYLANFELVATNVIPRTWKEPVQTSIAGVTIWGVTLH